MSTNLEALIQAVRGAMSCCDEGQAAAEDWGMEFDDADIPRPTVAFDAEDELYAALEALDALRRKLQSTAR